MNKFIKIALVATGTILVAGCIPTDEYYAESTYAIVPMYGTDGAIINNYYQPSYVVRGYWPSYSRPYVQRQYYYVWY